MNVQKVISALRAAGRETEALKARIAAYEREKEQIVDVRQRLAVAEARLRTVLEMFDDLDLPPPKVIPASPGRRATMDAVLAVMRAIGEPVHRSTLSHELDSRGVNTRNGEKLTLKKISAILNHLQSEGKVHHTSHRGYWVATGVDDVG